MRADSHLIPTINVSHSTHDNPVVWSHREAFFNCVTQGRWMRNAVYGIALQAFHPPDVALPLASTLNLHLPGSRHSCPLRQRRSGDCWHGGLAKVWSKEWGRVRSLAAEADNNGSEMGRVK